LNPHAFRAQASKTCVSAISPPPHGGPSKGTGLGAAWQRGSPNPTPAERWLLRDGAGSAELERIELGMSGQECACGDSWPYGNAFGIDMAS
jgi:hypothetical protein